jgi:hypothetical protein
MRGLRRSGLRHGAVCTECQRERLSLDRQRTQIPCDSKVRSAMATPGHSAKSSTFPLRLAYSVNRGIPGFMGGASTVLTLVKEGDLWRVQIAWPSGTTHYFVKFGSEREASGWISRHRWLTERGVEGATIRRPWGSVSLRKSVVDVATSESSPEQQEKD